MKKYTMLFVVLFINNFTIFFASGFYTSWSKRCKSPGASIIECLDKYPERKIYMTGSINFLLDEDMSKGQLKVAIKNLYKLKEKCCIIDKTCDQSVCKSIDNAITEHTNALKKKEKNDAVA